MKISAINSVPFKSAESDLISNNVMNSFMQNSPELNQTGVHFQQNITDEQPKKSLMEKFLNFVGNFKKVMVNIGDWTGGTVKGLGLGALVGGITTGTMFLGNIVLNGSKRIKAPKAPNKPLFIGAGVVTGLATLLGTLYNTKLGINKKSHDIDVKYVSTPMITK